MGATQLKGSLGLQEETHEGKCENHMWKKELKVHILLHRVLRVNKKSTYPTRDTL